MSSHNPIGVFDSGVGGLSILRALRAELPGEDFVYLADAGHAPYGERGDAYVVERTRAVVRRLRDEHHIKALVIACNTATAAAVHLVRREHPGLPVVGVEPAFKPAAGVSRTRRIAVLGTRGTMESAKVAALHDALRDQAEFLLQPCDGLADAIQRDDDAEVARLCEKYTLSLGRFGAGKGEIDTLVLGCTHYIFAERHFRRCVGAAVRIIETGEPVARQARVLLESAGLLRADASAQGTLTLLSTGDPDVLHKAATRWLS